MPTDPLRVLILDDEDMVRENLEMYLEDEGFEVFPALSGEMAITILTRQRLDAGVIDIRLPGMTGDEFIARASAIQPWMRFIVHTGSTEYVLPPELRALGLDESHVFTKPIDDMERLVAHLRGAEAPPCESNTNPD